MSKLDGTVLCGFPWKTHLVYLVDVLIYSHSFSEHLQDLEEIHYRLKSSGVNLNPCKMLFHQGSSTVFLAMLYPRTAAGHTPKMRSVGRLANSPLSSTSKSLLGTLFIYSKFMQPPNGLSVKMHSHT